MDWITGMQKAIDYIEDNITNKLDYIEIAKKAYSSIFHFQRVFSIMCGYTVGEYIRYRRLSLAGNELANSNVKVIDVAIKYGYESPDSFAKAFTRFHGITPSYVHKEGVILKSFSRLLIKISLEGGNTMDYKIEKKAAFELVGYKRRFVGDAAERCNQERDFWIQTRDEQEILRKIRNASENIWYDLNYNFTDDGYDHYIGVISEDLVPGGFEKIKIPEQVYAIFQTGRVKYPTVLLPDLRKKIVTEWLFSSDYVLADGPEVQVAHWYPEGSDNKYIEIWLPVEKK